MELKNAAHEINALKPCVLYNKFLCISLSTKYIVCEHFTISNKRRARERERSERKRRKQLSRRKILPKYGMDTINERHHSNFTFKPFDNY